MLTLLSFGVAKSQSTSPGSTSKATAGIAISHAGARPVVAGSAKLFTGSVEVEQLFPADAPALVSAGTVTFAPGARTNWHTHPYGQVLLITAGKGRVQMDGGPVQEVKAGDVVRIPAHVRHWHGASPDSSMTHVAIQDNLNGNAVDWMEPVTDAQYNGGK
jgi:4-carboxymuconolactone decarboxylase